MIDIIARLSAALAVVSAALAVTILPAPASADTAITEDSALWDCRVHGNRVCGPGNGQGVPAGDYSQWAGR